MKRTAEFLRVARRAALDAGLMLRKNLDAAQKVSFKGTVDLVTEFDNLSQEMIFNRISASFPEHGFLAEEGLAENKGAAFRWIFDPLDGTTNFAHGFPIFSVSIALEHRGSIILGVVYDPTREEMFSALAGGGAFLNRKGIKVSRTNDLNKSLLSTGFPYDVRDSRVNNLDHFSNFVTRAQAVRRCGSAALDLCYVACGRFDGFWELKLKPWDVAAGKLIVEEAGGKVSDFRGRRFNVFCPEVLATNGLVHKAMMKVLRLGKAPSRMV